LKNWLHLSSANIASSLQPKNRFFNAGKVIGAAKNVLTMDVGPVLLPSISEAFSQKKFSPKLSRNAGILATDVLN